MRLIPEQSALPRLLVFPFGLLAAAGFLAAAFQPDRLLKYAHCPLRDLTGLPCLTCGGTHTAVALASGRMGEALRTNPLVAVGLALFLLWVVYALVATVFPALRRSLQLTPVEKRTARWLAALLLMVAWIRQIVFMAG